MAAQNISNYLLPSTTYESPSRLARKQTLNTIIEDKYEENEEEFQRTPEAMRRLEGERSVGSVSPVPSLTSSISSYYKNRRDSSDFDDLYDLSDDDSELCPSVITSSRSTRSISPNPVADEKPSKPRCPSLVIPSPQFWPTVQKTSTESPPRPPKIPLSPASLSMLGQDLRHQSNTPSLVSSLTSDPFVGHSAPANPGAQACHARAQKSQRPVIRIRTDEEALSPVGSADQISVRDFGFTGPHERTESPVLGSEDGLSGTGVELPAEALRTLQHLSLEAPKTDDGAQPQWNEMQERFEIPSRSSSADEAPASAISTYSISKMSIPSPGGFFSSLGGNARKTWCVTGSVPVSALPPSSTTAENFYNTPWTKEASAPVEQIIEVDNADTDGPPTARQVPKTATTVLTATPKAFQARSSPRLPADEMMDLHEGDYEQAIQDSADKTLDRTSSWLAAQTSYMSALRETNPVNDISVEAEQELKRITSHKRDTSLGSPMRKAVKFLETETAKHEFERTSDPESALHYQAFKHIKSEQRRSDAYTHRHTRSDSVQSIRIALPQEHINRLQGDFQISPVARPQRHRPISMMPGKGAEDEEETPEQKMIAQVERERQALEQVSPHMWIVEATKYLNGGRLINNPATQSPKKILDLAGQPNCDWAWHCARDFPQATVYTASTDVAACSSPIRGPRNHQRVAVDKLWDLPFADSTFDVISARSLPAYLKTEKLAAEASGDEYDLCLQECLRCLKPGGYLEFSLQDSEILNAGSRSTAVSVEFGFNLKTRGYDPAPTKSFLGRLRRAGFDGIKRAWTMLPMGAASAEGGMSAFPETPPPDASTFEAEVDKLEAVRGPIGSTADVASVTGLVGAWTWEQWMLRLQMEMGKKNLLEGVAAVLEEGKATGAGWRCLSGWARKPM